ncbi:MAG: ketopantoate reductase family protein [Candidatus Bathyarchaeota archaeon]|jgi:2-dehydropantoate 2-reductase
MSFNKIFVLGAGAIGSTYGALLSRKHDVTLIGSRKHVETIRAKGLSLSGSVNETFQVNADTKIRGMPENSMIILSTKAYDTEKTIKENNELIKEDTVILIIQNGLGNEDVVKKTVRGSPKILRAITTTAAEFLESGNVKFWKGFTIMKKEEATKRIAKIFNDCGIKTKLSNKFKEEIWKKLIVNCIVNPLTALLRVRNCEILADSLKEVRHNIFLEGIKVGEAEGTSLSPSLEATINKKLSSYTNLSSMYQDIMKGKQTEIDFLNNKIVELGRKNSIPTPVNETVTSLIKFMEEQNGVSRRDQAEER